MFFIVELININDVKEKDYYLESKRLRKEALEIAEIYKGNPKRFSISNGIDMEVEITMGANTYLCVRRMKSNGVYKPYAFIDQQTFDNEKNNIVKEKPPL